MKSARVGIFFLFSGCALFLGAVPAHAIQWNSATNSYDWAETLVNASPGGQTSSTATTVKASHVQEILEAIADIRANAACGALPVDSVVTAATYNAATGSLISSQHIQGLRDAIKRIRPSASGVPASAAGGTNSVWGNSITTNSSTQIKASDFQDMRLALNQIRASCGGSVPVCGNGGPLEAGEQCDDGNTANGDGCSSTCQNESACTIQIISSGMVCKAFTDPGSTCGAITLGSACTLPGPSCQSSSTENEFNLPGGPCDVPGPGGWWSGFVQDVGCACGPAPICGDGALAGAEQCDDFNTVNGDGCDLSCQLEVGSAVCGNGTTETGEQCDDTNTLSGDGCSSTCQIEPNQSCPGDLVWTGTQCDCLPGQTVSGTTCVPITCPSGTAVYEMPFGIYTMNWDTDCSWAMAGNIPGGNTLNLFWTHADCGGAPAPLGQYCIVDGSRRTQDAGLIGCGGPQCLYCSLRTSSTGCAGGGGGGGGGSCSQCVAV